MPNVFDDEFTGRLDLSSEETAMFLYDLAPDGSLPYHYEYVEEWLLVVDGAVVVRLPDREVEVGRGTLMRFAPGPTGAHQIINREAVKARVLLFSNATLPSVGVFPDTGTIGIWLDNDTELYFKRSDAVSDDEAV